MVQGGQQVEDRRQAEVAGRVAVEEDAVGGGGTSAR